MYVIDVEIAVQYMKSVNTSTGYFYTGSLITADSSKNLPENFDESL